MDQVHVIRHKVLIEGRSIRWTAHEMGVSRNTVRKYLEQPEPRRCEPGPRVKPVLEEVAPRIESLLMEWSHRTTPKQRITGSRVHQQLLEEGYKVGVSTVRIYLREKRRQASEVYIPLVHRCGDSAQVDFFEVTVNESGEMRKAWKLLIRLMYSGRDFVHLYDRCDQVSFLEGHVRAFAEFGGVPRRLVYDNLSAAVKRRVGLKRELTDRFQALVSHYLYEACFARSGEGHDKGGVESRGKGIRLQHRTPIPEGKCLSAISETVRESIQRQAERRRDIEGRTVIERFSEEQMVLRPLPAVPFDARKVELVDVSRQAMILVDRHWKDSSRHCTRCGSDSTSPSGEGCRFSPATARGPRHTLSGAVEAKTPAHSTADHRRVGFCAFRSCRRRTALQRLRRTLRTALDDGDDQSAV